MKDGESTGETLGSTPAPKEFFERLLLDAKREGGFRTSAASDLYVVGLLTEAARSPAAIPEMAQPFTLRLHRAMDATGGERFERFRRLGDEVLFVSGFFSSYLETRGVALDYVASVGRRAYTGAASMLRVHATGPQIFDELAESFTVFVTMLRQVADSLAALSARDELSVLELYERWQRSQSDVLTRALLELGLLPSRGPREAN
jgi:hypothetical protein